MNHRLALLAALLFAFRLDAALVEIPDKVRRWQTFTNSTHVPTAYGDGDSFRVKLGDGREFVFRLGFVDCPESDKSEPTRNMEQAEFFAVPVGDVPAWGKLATEKVRELLAKPFTVHTRWASALGRSRLPRFYATITTADGKDLGEELLALGLAREQGQRMEPPSREKTDDYKRKLRRIEADAKSSRAGIWSGTLPK